MEWLVIITWWYVSQGPNLCLDLHKKCETDLKMLDSWITALNVLLTLITMEFEYFNYIFKFAQ